MKPLKRLPSLDPVVTIGGCFAALGLAFTAIHLGQRSLWYDELWTMALAAPSVSQSESLAVIRADVHPPLYFLAVRAWLQLFNDSSETLARAFNFLPFAFAVAMAVRALHQRQVKEAVLWFVLFFASFGAYWFLQEARMYSMVIAQSLCGCIVVMEFEKRRVLPITIGYVLLLTFIFVVFPLAHWFSAAFSAGLLGALCLWAFVDRKFNYAVLFAALGLSLCSLGALWVLFNLNSTVGSLGSYGKHIYNGSLSLWGLRVSGVGTLLFALTLNPILVLAAIYGVWQVGTRPRQNIGASVILLVSGLLALTILCISLKSPVYQTRNFTWLIAPITLFSAIGIEKVFRQLSLPRMHQALAIGAVLLLSGGIARSAPQIYPLEIDDWRDAGKMIASTPGCETADVPVWIPWLAERPSDLFTRVAQRMYGYYAGHPERIRPLGMARLPDKGATLCPVVLWIAQMSPSEAISEGRRILGMDADNLEKVELRGHLVFMRPAVGAGDASGPRQ